MIGKIKLTRGKFNWHHLSKAVDKGRERGLRQAGAIVYRRSQNEIKLKSLSGAYSETTTETINVSGRDYRMLRWSSRKSEPSRLSTYRSSRFPKGFMRWDMQFVYDRASDSVVVGPVSVPWLNALHEFGGNKTVRLWVGFPTGQDYTQPDEWQRANPGVAQWRNDPYRSRAYTRNWQATTITRTARYPKRPYMGPGLAKALPKIAEQFRDQIRGP
jgi:hypothetical protein